MTRTILDESDPKWIPCECEKEELPARAAEWAAGEIKKKRAEFERHHEDEIELASYVVGRRDFGKFTELGPV